MVNSPDKMSNKPAARREAPDISQMNDPDAIRAEINRTRSQMGRTLNEIQWQLSPEVIREQTEEAIREATVEKVETMARKAEHTVNSWRSNAIDTVRDNPLPAALTALGLGWLIMSGRNSDDKRDYDDYGDYRRRGRVNQRYYEGYAYDNRDPRSTARYRYPLNSDYETYDDFGYDPDDFENAYAANAGRRPGTVTRGTGAPGSTHEPSAEQIRRAAAETGEWAGEQVDEAREWAAETSDEARQRLHETTDAVRDTAESMRESADETWSHASESAQETADLARERAIQARRRARMTAMEAQREMRQEMRQVKRSFWDTMEDNPLAVGIAALAAGALVGLAIPSTERENELIGPTRDSLVEDMTDTVQQTVQKAQTVVEETAQTAVSEAKSAVNETKKEAQQQAQKQDLTMGS